MHRPEVSIASIPCDGGLIRVSRWFSGPAEWPMVKVARLADGRSWPDPADCREVTIPDFARSRVALALLVASNGASLERADLQATEDPSFYVVRETPMIGVGVRIEDLTRGGVLVTLSEMQGNNPRRAPNLKCGAQVSMRPDSAAAVGRAMVRAKGIKRT